MTAKAGREYETTRRLSLKDLTSLPPTIDLKTAAQILGIGRTAAYALVRAGHWPTPVVRAGRLIRVPTAPLLHLLGLNQLHEDNTRQSQGVGKVPLRCAP
jgi:predicted DNA-binding transcriptional regulator AlpA